MSVLAALASAARVVYLFKRLEILRLPGLTSIIIDAILLRAPQCLWVWAFLLIGIVWTDISASASGTGLSPLTRCGLSALLAVFTVGEVALGAVAAYSLSIAFDQALVLYHVGDGCLAFAIILLLIVGGRALLNVLQTLRTNLEPFHTAATSTRSARQSFGSEENDDAAAFSTALNDVGSSSSSSSVAHVSGADRGRPFAGRVSACTLLFSPVRLERPESAAVWLDDAKSPRDGFGLTEEEAIVTLYEHLRQATLWLLVGSLVAIVLVLDVVIDTILGLSTSKTPGPYLIFLGVFLMCEAFGALLLAVLSWPRFLADARHREEWASLPDSSGDALSSGSDIVTDDGWTPLVV